MVAGGAAVVGDDVIAVAGIREPGLDEPSRTSGVTLFSLDAGRAIPTVHRVDQQHRVHLDDRRRSRRPRRRASARRARSASTSSSRRRASRRAASSR